MEVGEKVNNIELLVKDTGERKNKKIIALFKCHCGKEFKKAKSVISCGILTHCGCKSPAEMEVGSRVNNIELLIRDTGLRDKHQKVISLFRCHCGKEFKHNYTEVKIGKTLSCGCINKINIEAGTMYNEIEFLRLSKNKSGDNHTLGEFKCFCGNKFECRPDYISKNIRKSCGCLLSEDLTGRKIGNLTVLEYTNRNTIGNSKIWKCKCDCGNIVDKPTDALSRRKNLSCKNCRRRDNGDKSGEVYGNITVLKKEDRFHSLSKNHMWTVKCICGTIFSVPTHMLKRRVSCGCDKTNILARAKRFSGENSPNWNPNLTDEDRIRYKKKDRSEQFRKLIFIRDSYTCVVCHATHCSLNAHHLNSYHWDKNGREDTKNSCTLCESCHKDFHKLYSNKWNTVDQFLQYCTIKGVNIESLKERLNNNV